MGPVVGVVGGSGGVGASSFAAVAAASAPEALLLDIDSASGGIDVLLGIDELPGARWSGLHLAGGSLDADVLLGGLPRWGRCAVLAADRAEIDPDAVRQVIDVAVSAGPVVVDLPRATCAERAAACLGCDALVVVARSDLSGLVAARAVVCGLPELPIGVVVRRGEIPADEAARLVGGELLGVLAPMRSRVRLDPGRLPRNESRIAAGVLEGVGVLG